MTCKGIQVAVRKKSHIPLDYVSELLKLGKMEQGANSVVMPFLYLLAIVFARMSTLI